MKIGTLLALVCAAEAVKIRKLEAETVAETSDDAKVGAEGDENLQVEGGEAGEGEQ